MNTPNNPLCGDCLGFSEEMRDENGKFRGRCRFRPELGMIPESLPYCKQFKVKLSREGKVVQPVIKPEPRRSGGSSPRTSSDSSTYRRTLRHPVTGDTSGEITVDKDGLKQIFRELLEEETWFGYPELGPKWEGGTLILKPGDPELQSKEVPIETLFHKIVMIRDRLRVLEAKVNAHDKLSEQEKVELEQYISKAYGTLTSFNVLFRNKEDHFKS